MIDILFVLIFSLVVFVLDVRQTFSNMSVPWNGFGSIGNTLKGTSQQPMQYRVLVPWMCGLLGETMGGYLAIKMIGIVLALSASLLYFNSISVYAYLPVSILSLFFIVAAIYDYADTYWEVGLIMMAFWLLSSPISLFSWPYLMLITLLATLNRETGGIIPMTAALTGEFLLSIGLFAIFIIGFIVPRIIYGKADRYCSFWMIRKNLEVIKDCYKKNWFIMADEYTHFFILLLFVLASALKIGSGIELGALFLFGVLLVPSMWQEIRVFALPVAVLLPVWLR